MRSAVEESSVGRSTSGVAPRRPSLGARLLLVLFRAYQLARTGRVSPCRFTPTCSQYAVEAVEHHGARRGVLLALRRLGRCRPGGPSGYDPIPE
jgi:putative membrane protein insertion efficiency factor